MFDRHFPSWPEGRLRSLIGAPGGPVGTVYDNLKATAKRRPDYPAILYYGTTITYRELHRDVEALAGYLQHDLGVAKGARVLLDMQNTPQWVIGFYAILRSDAIAVPVNPMSQEGELRYLTEDAGARHALIGAERLDFYDVLLNDGVIDTALIAAYGDALTGPTDLTLPDAVAMDMPPLDHPGLTAWGDAISAGLMPGPAKTKPEDAAVLPYSSGTTGQPKGCLHTHQGTNAAIFSYIHWGPHPDDAVTLVSLPLFHVTALQNGMNVPIFAGSTMVLMTRWDRDVAAQLIERHHVTHWRFITTMAIDFFDNPELSDTNLTSLEAIGGGGAQMPEALAETIKQTTGLDYVEGYGLTETMAGVIINPPERAKPQCLGIPVFDVDCRVIDPETSTENAVKETGEIVLRAPQLFERYWNDEDATDAAFIELEGQRFFRTGDLGHYDDEGYIFFTDRLKRMVNASGYKVWPAEVEALMLAHPGIREVCVIAAPDPKRGETVKAVIIPTTDPPPIPEDLETWCREHMAAYKVPRLFEFTNDLPRSSSGKVLWRVLQAGEVDATT